MLLTETVGIRRIAETMRIRLTRKLADAIDGVAVADYSVGDVIDLDTNEARLLIAEDWAVAVNPRREKRQATIPVLVADAADSDRRNPLGHLRRVSQQIDARRFALPHGRRREDVLVDELRDARARTVRTRRR